MTRLLSRTLIWIGVYFLLLFAIKGAARILEEAEFAREVEWIKEDWHATHPEL